MKSRRRLMQMEKLKRAYGRACEFSVRLLDTPSIPQLIWSSWKRFFGFALLRPFKKTEIARHDEEDKLEDKITKVHGRNMIVDWWNNTDKVGTLGTLLTYGAGILALIAAYVNSHYTDLRDKELTDSNTRVENLEKRQGRRLSESQRDKIVAAVRADAKEQVAVLYPNGDIEAFQFADDLAKALREGGFEVEVMGAYTLAEPLVGVLVSTNPKSANNPEFKAVQAALTSANISYDLRLDEGMSYIPWVKIGRRK